MEWEREKELNVDGCTGLIKATAKPCTVLMGKETDSGSYYAVTFEGEQGIVLYHFTDIVLLGGHSLWQSL